MINAVLRAPPRKRRARPALPSPAFYITTKYLPGISLNSIFFARHRLSRFQVLPPLSPICAMISPDTGERRHKSFSWGRDPLRLRTGGGRRRSGRSARARGSVPEPAAPPDDMPRISSRSRQSLNRTRKQQSTVPKAALFVLSGRLFVIFDFALQRYHIEFWQDL